MSNTTAPRKTAKYYREILSGNNISKSLSVLPEVIKKFGYKRWDKYSKFNDTINLRHYTEFVWNHRINSFFLTEKGELCVDIYWQGDSTDGNDCLTARECANGKTIPAEHEFIGGRTYYKHGDLRISREEFADAVKAVAKYLSPEAIKERKEAERKAELSKQVYDFIAEQTKDRDEYYWNGRIAVQKLLEKELELFNLTFEELKPIVLYVYKSNAKSDYYLRGGWYNGEKKYNLAYPAEMKA